MDIEHEMDVFSVHTPIPSTISCKVLRILPSQIIVNFKWNQRIYAGVLWDISKR